MKRMFSGLAFVMLPVCVSVAQKLSLQLPEPPRQHATWRPDAKIPTNILSAVQTMFSQGFPDPRGCEYREIEVEVSGVWGGKSSQVKTRGWILPKKSRSTNDFAICWNGLIYPVRKILAPANLYDELTNSAPISNRRYNNVAVGETDTVLFSRAQTTRVLLLLRCGETDAALNLWSPSQQTLASTKVQEGIEKADPYLEFASDWAWAMFDRTICAHMRGDEAIALATARELATAQPKIETECTNRGFRHQYYIDSSFMQGKEKPYLDFLEQLPQIVSDLERRAREGNRESYIQTGLQTIIDQSARITTLIRDLDLVQARQFSQPGWVNLPGDPIVSALIQEGDPAVEPLIDCVEHDQRLTRSVGFGRDFVRGRTVITVSNAAMAAVQSILQSGFHDAAELQRYWDKYQGTALDERCFAILEDDSASARWLEAAAHITQPENETTYPGGFSEIKPAPTNAPVRLRGESLRNRANPSVSELMARRALDVPAKNLNSYDLPAACQMGLRLAKWDQQAALPVATALVKRCCDVMKYSDQRLGIFVAQLSLARAYAGDPHAFDEYAAWLKTTSPEVLDNSAMECLEPLQEFPTNAVLDAAAESLFSNPNSGWNKYPWTKMGLQDPIESGLNKVPAFRRWAARLMDNTSICGSIEFLAPDRVGFQVTNFMGGSRSVEFPQNEKPASGTKSDLRWCDWIAFSLSNAKQIPFFDPLAPVEKRDDAIRNAKRVLDQ